jgi:CSLREA domain-containing protein
MKHLRLFLPIALPLILLSLFFTTLQTNASPSATFTVNSTVDAVDANPGDGVCETGTGNGICTLRAAVQETNALPGEDTILLSGSTYLLTIAGIGEDAAATGDLDITDALIIVGSSSSSTLIDGNRLDRVLEVAVDASLTINQVVVANGRVDTGTSGVGGAGILNSSSLTVKNSWVFSNTAHTLRGGGLYNNGGAITITNSTIISNAITGNSAREGAGISNFSGSLYIESSQVANNIGGFGYGGGIYSGQNAIISDTVITNNDADFGGGLYLSGSALVVNSIISDNVTISGATDAGRGGGIYYESSVDALEISNSVIISNTGQQGAGIYLNGVMTMTNSRVSDNFVYGDGGGIFATLSDLTIADSTIDHNKTFPAGSNFGGGIYAAGFFDNDKFSMSGSTVNNNSAGTAAGIYLNGGSHTIQNSTLAYNETTDDMGQNTSSAIRIAFGNLSLENSTVANNIAANSTDGAIVASNLGIFTVTNSIIANNVGGNCSSFGSPPELEGEIVSNGNNISSDASCNFTQPTDLPNTDPLLGPLQNNGGLTDTFALLENSPAIDAGSNANCLATDQRGISRPIDGDGNGTAVCDIGAVEMETIATSNQFIYLPLIVKP